MSTANDTRDLIAKSRVTNTGSFTVDGHRTSYIEFRLAQPRGAHKVCTCNECWLRYFVSMFGFAGECPRCHSDQVAWHEEIGRHARREE